MKLVAVYLPEHKFLFSTPQTINFGGQYLYTFSLSIDKSIQITRKKNSNYIENFFAETISNISAIVGENGAGKTVLMSKIYDQISDFSIDYHIPLYEFESFLIFENDSKTIIFSKIYYDTKGDSDKHPESIPSSIENRMIGCFSMEVKFIDDAYILNKLGEKNLYRDFRPDFRPLYYSAQQVTHQNLNTAFRLDIIDDIKFLSNSALVEKIAAVYGDINFYKSIEISPNDHGYNFKSVENFIYRNIFPKKFLSDSDLENIIGNSIFIDNRYFFFNYLNEIYLNEKKNIKGININGFDWWEEKKHNDRLFEINCQVVARIFFKVVQLDFEVYQFLCRKYMRKIDYSTLKTKNSFLKLIRLVISDINGSKNIPESLKSKFSSFLSFCENIPEDLKMLLTTNNIPKNNQFLQSYFDILGEFDLHTDISGEADAAVLNAYFLRIIPEAKISYGERMMIKLFSFIYSRKTQHISLLLLDEPETGFHPQWKKKFIYAIVKILPIIMEKENSLPLQIIFTTHDPLTLSDIPNGNIVYLRKNEDGRARILDENETDRPKRSFAANISDLLADSFFINDGLVGDFAKSKIEQVISWLNLQKNKKNTLGKDYKLENNEVKYYKQVINIIDEQIIKNKLAEMLDSLFDEEDFQKDLAKREIEILMRKNNLTKDDLS